MNYHTPQFSINNLSDQVLFATFYGLSRTDEELIYFDKQKGDVLKYVQGFFCSLIEDQSIVRKNLADKIINDEPSDFVDENRYILIDRLKLPDFLNEYKKQTGGKEPFCSFVDDFSTQVLKEFSYYDNLTIDDIANSVHIQEKFHDFFKKKYQNRFLELREDYSVIFHNTQEALAVNWIKKNI